MTGEELRIQEARVANQRSGQRLPRIRQMLTRKRSDTERSSFVDSADNPSGSSPREKASEKGISSEEPTHTHPPGPVCTAPEQRQTPGSPAGHAEQFRICNHRKDSSQTQPPCVGTVGVESRCDCVERQRGEPRPRESRELDSKQRSSRHGLRLSSLPNLLSAFHSE